MTATMSNYKDFQPCSAPSEYAYLRDERNPYYQKLVEFPNYVFIGEEAECYRGKWIRDVFKMPDITTLEVEVGVGHGHSFTANAQRHSSHAFVGMDYSYKPLYRTARKIHHSAITNARLILGRAERLLALFGPSEIDQMYVLFPDPWERHKKWGRRLLSPGFFKLVADCLKSGGKVWIKTDHLEYFTWFLQQIQINQLPFGIIRATHDLHASDHCARDMITHFERIFLAKKQQICFAEFMRL